MGQINGSYMYMQVCVLNSSKKLLNNFQKWLKYMYVDRFLVFTVFYNFTMIVFHVFYYILTDKIIFHYVLAPVCFFYWRFISYIFFTCFCDFISWKRNAGTMHSFAVHVRFLFSNFVFISSRCKVWLQRR